MKIRNRKKVLECSHYYYERFMVTDDPYPIYDSDEYCKIKWKELQDKTETNGENRPNYCEICSKCKHFTVTRPNIRKERKRKRKIKEIERYWKNQERIAFRDGKYEERFDSMINFDLPF